MIVMAALMTLAGGVMGLYGSFPQLEAWQESPLVVVIALLLSGLLLAGGSCLFRRGIRYQGRNVIRISDLKF